METFKPTHKIIDGDKEILVQEIVGDDEFFTQEDFDDFYPDPCMLGSYGLEPLNKHLILVRSISQDEEFKDFVTWKLQPHLIIIKICPNCCSENIVKDGAITKGRQKYLCSECGEHFTGTSSIKPYKGDRRMI